jgi:ABC-2 type transport system permease protein
MTTQPIAASGPSGLYWAFSDARVLAGRNLRHIARSPEQMMLMLFLPIAMLLVFRYLFGGAIDVGDTAYINYVLPGIVTVTVTFNATITSVGVCNDLLEGIVERFRSMPVLNSAVLIGHVTAALVRNLVSLATLIVAGYAIGFRPRTDVRDWVIVVALLVLFMLGVSWLAAILGLLARSVEAASGLTMPLVFIPYISSALVPTETMPGVLRAIAEHQPVTLVIDTVRAAFLGLPLGGTGWFAALCWVGIVAVAVPLTGRLFRRKITRSRP